MLIFTIIIIIMVIAYSAPEPEIIEKNVLRFGRKPKVGSDFELINQYPFNLKINSR